METENLSYPWYALWVKSRYENTVASHLQARGYESFLPLYKCQRRWSDRFKEIELPLFPGYVFCQFNPLNRLPILSITSCCADLALSFLFAETGCLAWDGQCSQHVERSLSDYVFLPCYTLFR